MTNFSYLDQDLQQRLLTLQLADTHDKGSRKKRDIVQHANWIHHHLFESNHQKVLDVACGPGFYSLALSKWGHNVVAFDISETAIAYAKAHSQNNENEITYCVADLLNLNLDDTFSAVIMPYSNINQFNQQEFLQIVELFNSLLTTKGILYFEALRFNHQIPAHYRSWEFQDGTSLFTDKIALDFYESSFDNKTKVQTTDTYTIDIATCQIKKNQMTVQHYTDDDYKSILEQTHFSNVRTLSHPPGTGKGEDHAFVSIIATKE